ncbi:MAG: SAM-dependent chlorinase/fluorinase [Lewinellaceae bacterium]|nr:SAM-dependent chlorinase/fluorinase [Lewinellaceae bacterium]
MSIVTLTTDFGSSDFYVGALKGALLRQHPALQLVDISHEIKPFNIIQGAFAVQQVWPEFAEGSIHLIAVNCIYAPDFRYVALRHGGHYFLAPDNGLLTLLFDAIAPEDVRILPIEGDHHFPVRQVFADAVAHLAVGGSFDTLGIPGEKLLQRINLQPVIMPDRIRGTVIHVDHFDNAIVNVRWDLFEQVRKDRKFSLFFKRNDPITRLSNNYCDVAEGEPLCLFNSSGFLEIAINMGRAASLLGLRPEEVVELVFE